MAGEAAFGTLLKQGAVPVTVANVTSISGPSFSLDTIDVTAHDSASNYRELVPSFISAGEINFDINYDPDGTTHAGLITTMVARTEEDWQIIWPDTTQADFKAYITAFEPGADYDGKLEASVTLSISGAVTYS